MVPFSAASAPGNRSGVETRPSRKEHFMEISVSEEVLAQLDQVKEWMESKIGREVTYNDVILQILKNFQDVLYPEDLGRS
jgi:hypothetical protein